jgi:hypothetical protein
MMTTVGCFQTYNSSSGDKSIYGASNIDVSSPAGQRFAAAYAVIKQYCFECHSGYAAYTTEAQWKAARGVRDEQLIVAGQLSASYLYARIRGSGVAAQDSETMPPNSDVSPADLAIIQDWITQML